MKRTLGVIFLFSLRFVSAQQYGAQWILGDAESVLDFRNDTVKNYSIGPIMPIFLTCASICDSFGNLLYYTNGISIAGSDGNQIGNGDSLNPCSYTNQYYGIGLNIPQAALFLPKPNDTSQYYLFHFSNDSADNLRPGTLYFSLINKELNGGAGTVIQKNVPVFHGILREGGMTACKHANGRDWWIIVPAANNEYFEVLLSPDTILGPYSQFIGPDYSIGLDVAYSKFSQDGSKYATGCYGGQILVMDFDRCTGEFSNPVTIFNEACDSPYSCSGADGIEFSPNGRFLYVTNSLVLNQYDLSSDSIQDSVLLYSENHDPAQMNFLQLGPNKKIYGSCHNGGYYLLHVVNRPDLKGDSSNYIDTGIITQTVNTNGLPNMVNYQLAALPGPCDTISSINSQVLSELQMQVFPNPARDILKVSYTASTYSTVSFELMDDLGQVLILKPLVMEGAIELDISHLASGLYLWRGRNGNTVVQNGKVSIQK